MTESKPKRYQCRHIFTDGHRCGSICLRGEEFCYYHHTTRKPAQNPRARRGRRSTFDLPVTDPNDRTGLQSTIIEVLRRIASNDIDPRRAGLLLYGLQIASLNLPKPQTAQRGRKVEEPETVEEITTHPELGILAPKTDIDEIPINPKSAIGLLMEQMTKSSKQESAAAQPTTLPTLQATTDAATEPEKSNLDRWREISLTRKMLAHAGIHRMIFRLPRRKSIDVAIKHAKCSGDQYPIVNLRVARAEFARHRNACLPAAPLPASHHPPKLKNALTVAPAIAAKVGHRAKPGSPASLLAGVGKRDPLSSRTRINP